MWRTLRTPATYPRSAAPAKITAMAEPEMRNPFRSEADAFRILVMIVVAGAIVIAAAVLVGSWLGVTLALIGFAIGVKETIGWLRVGLGEPDEEQDSDATASDEAAL